MAFPVVYDGERVDAGYRLDLLVCDMVIVEVKAVEEVHPVVRAQILSYLRLSGKPVGLVINFGVEHLRDGIKRYANLQGHRTPSGPATDSSDPSVPSVSRF